jgi:peptide/nickel transport system substrate-binding protein
MKRKDFVYIAGILLLVQMAFVGVQYGSAAAPFIYGVMEGPPEIEPTDAYDSASIDVITQVCEGLYQFNLSSKDCEITPMLAKALGTWSSDNLSLTVELKQNVTFHDGSKFNATSVKWNFDRLLNFTISNKDLQTATLFQYKGMNILNKTEIIDEYKVKFVLNMPYKLWDKLLGFSSTFILKPNEDYQSRFLTLEDKLIGTGPFVYDGYEPDTKTTFHSPTWFGKLSPIRMRSP